MRSLDSYTQAAIADRMAISPVNFVTVTARDDENAETVFGFTDYGESVSVTVVDGLTGSNDTIDFEGDEAPILSIPPIPLKIGLDIDTVEVVLNPLHPAVESMARSYIIRHAAVQIHRGYRDLQTGGLVAAPRARLVGQVNGAPIETGGAGERSSLRLKVVSSVRELTRISTLKWSDETQRLRSDDRFLRYVDNTEDIQVWWGEAGA